MGFAARRMLKWRVLIRRRLCLWQWSWCVLWFGCLSRKAFQLRDLLGVLLQSVSDGRIVSREKIGEKLSDVSYHHPRDDGVDVDPVQFIA